MSDVVELRCAPEGWRPSRIRIGVSLAGSPGAELGRVCDGHRSHVLLDEGVAAAWPELDRACNPIRVPGGERCKDFATLESVLREIIRRGVDRDSRLVAIGGGAVCDLGGLAASLCLRGIGFVAVPTTLLAMVDASVGGKTAIDVAEGKNLIGTFWPAGEVLVDPAFTRSESEPQFRSGLAEVAKIALGIDSTLFDLCDRRAGEMRARDGESLLVAIQLALAAKIRIVERDPLETDERRLLNLGHTLGHALEAWSGYARPHGLAVAQGLHHVLELARARGLLAADPCSRGRNLLDRLGLPLESLPPLSELLEFVARDKKVRNALVQAVLPTGIGRAQVLPMTPQEFLRL